MNRIGMVIGIVAAGIIGASTVAEAQSLNDATIVAIFDAANAADIETGNLAAKRAVSKEVRDYGTMLAQVHTQVRKKAIELANKLGVVPTPPANDQGARDHAAAMKRLGALEGPEFDRAFLAHEEAFHAAVLAAVKSTLLPAIQNRELKDFVVSLAPAFEAHRQAAASLQQRLASK